MIKPLIEYDFALALPRDWEERWTEAKRLARQYGFSVDRRGNMIKISGPVSGVITVVDGRGYVRITKKPFYMSIRQIENKIRKYLSKVA